MDPSLYASMYVCPECMEGFLPWGEEWLKPCERCQGTGYLLEHELKPGEQCKTALEERGEVIVRIEE